MVAKLCAWRELRARISIDPPAQRPSPLPLPNYPIAPLLLRVVACGRTNTKRSTCAVKSHLRPRISMCIGLLERTTLRTLEGTFQVRRAYTVHLCPAFARGSRSTGARVFQPMSVFFRAEILHVPLERTTLRALEGAFRTRRTAPHVYVLPSSKCRVPVALGHDHRYLSYSEPHPCLC